MNELNVRRLARAPIERIPPGTTSRIVALIAIPVVGFALFRLQGAVNESVSFDVNPSRTGGEAGFLVPTLLLMLVAGFYLGRGRRDIAVWVVSPAIVFIVLGLIIPSSILSALVMFPLSMTTMWFAIAGYVGEIVADRRARSGAGPGPPEG